MTTQEQDRTRAAWDAIAAGYDEFVTPSHLWLGNEAVTRAGIRPGMRVLDVACGSGALSIPAARLGATVLSVDLSPTMIQRLRARAAEEGLTIDTRVMDGHALAFEDHTFDIAGSQFGVMLFPDLPRGLSEMVRVTKPEGKVVVVTVGPPPQIEFFGFFLAAMKAVVPDFAGPPSDPPPDAFQVADADVFHARMCEAGLKDITIETITERLEFRSGKHLWGWLLGSNPLATMITAGLATDQVGEVQNAMEQLIRARARGGDTAVLTHPNHIGIGRT